MALSSSNSYIVKNPHEVPHRPECNTGLANDQTDHIGVFISNHLGNNVLMKILQVLECIQIGTATTRGRG